MANLTNSAKLIEEMEKKINASAVGKAGKTNDFNDLDNKPNIPTVNNSTITIQKNGANVDSFTTNAASAKTINIQLTKSDVDLGNVDNTSDANKPISNATQTALNTKADASAVYTKAETDSAISSAISSVYRYKGSVANYASLPSSGQVVGDVWNVEDTGDNYAWAGTVWDKLAGTVDLSNYLAKNNTTAFTPTGDYHPATKKYVDDVAAGINSAEWGNISGTLSNQTDLQTALNAKVGSSNNTINNVVHLSQSEYDALTTKDPNTWYSTPDDESGGFNPQNSGTTGQMLTRTATGYDWETKYTVPDGGASGQVLTKSSSGYGWAPISGEIVYITQDDYDALPSSKLTDNKNYFIIDEYPSTEGGVSNS